MLLESVLHLNDKLLAFLILAIHVEYGFTVGIDIAYILAVEEFHVLDDLFFPEQ